MTEDTSLTLHDATADWRDVDRCTLFEEVGLDCEMKVSDLCKALDIYKRFKELQMFPVDEWSEDKWDLIQELNGK